MRPPVAIRRSLYARKLQRHINKWKRIGKKYDVQALPEWRERRGYARRVARQAFPKRRREGSRLRHAIIVLSAIEEKNGNE